MMSAFEKIETGGAGTMTNKQITMTKDEFVEWAEQYIRLMCTGMVACNPMVPRPIMGEVIAEAMGRCLGSMTAYPEPNQVIEVRRKYTKLFKHAIKEAYPAMQQPLQQVRAPAQGTH